jgi:hypothetical protein
VIVVVGSRHDDDAQSMVAALPCGALCSAEDLTRPGWVWSVESAEPPYWVIDGVVVADREVTGVFVRRTCVYPEELTTTHPDDREYLAAESTAFLVFVLSRSEARVVNSVCDGAIGEDAVRPERWMPYATSAGLRLAPLAVRPQLRRRDPGPLTTAEVVGSQVYGDAPAALDGPAVELACALGLDYAAFVFDRRRRLMAVSATKRPSDAALPALCALLRG